MKKKKVVPSSKAASRQKKSSRVSKKPIKKTSPRKTAAEYQWRERRLKDIPFVDRHPTPETAKKYNDTLPLPFGGEVKKDAMRDHGLFH